MINAKQVDGKSYFLPPGWQLPTFSNLDSQAVNVLNLLFLCTFPEALKILHSLMSGYRIHFMFVKWKEPI